MTTTKAGVRLCLMTLGLLGAVAARPGLVSAQPAAAFNPLVNVSNSAAQVSDLAAVTLDGSTIYAAWREQTPGGSQVRLRRSTNGGVSFIDGAAGRVAAIVDPAETVHTVRVAANGSIVYLLYTSGLEPRLAKARLARSVNGGVTFAAPITLADTVEFGGSAFADVAVDGTGAVHVVIEDRDFSGDILYLFSTDQGVTFSTPAALAGSPEPSVRPRMTARGAQIAIAWEELVLGAGEIAFIYSANAGASFGPVQNLSTNAADSKGPAVAIGNLIHVAWTEGGSVMLRSSLNGAAFTPAAPAGIAPPTQTIAGSAVGSSANTLHVSWTTVGADGLMNGPFYRRSTDGGGTFAAAQDLRLGLVGTPVGTPAILNGTVARIVWPHSPSGFAPDADVLFAGQPNCGISWAAAVSGNWNDATKWSPAVIPGAGSSACITVEGATPYTVTVPSNQNVSELTIGHATTAVRPIVRITGSLSIGSSLVNSGEITFGSDGQIASTAGSVLNTERGRLTTQAAAPASLNATAINYGEVDLAAQLTIATAVGRSFTNFGTFTIRPAGSTVFGGGFVFNQNDGVVNVEGAMEFSAEFSTAGDTFNFNGGSVEGVVTIQGHSRLNIGAGSKGKGTFQFERNVTFGISSGGHLSGNIAPAQTIRLMGTVGGSSQAIIAAGLTNAGRIELSATATNADGAVLAIQAGTVVNTGTILVERSGDVAAGRIDGFLENRGTLDIRDDLTFGANGRITNLGTTTIGAEAAVAFGSNYVFNQNGGVLTVAGKMELSAEFSTGGDTFNFNDGTVAGTVIIQGHSRLNIGPGSQGAGTFQFERNSTNATLTGNIAPAQTLRLITQPGAHAASVVAANGFTNAGTIVLDAASLVVTGGTLVNTGTIAVDATSPVIGRAIDANIDNRGTFTVAADLSLRGTNRTFTNTGTVRVLSGATVSLGSTAVFNQQAGLLDVGGALVLNREFNTGPDTFNFNGGEVHGFVTLQTVSTLNIGPASNGRGEFVFRFGQTNNNGGTMTGNIAPLQTVRIVGCCGFNQEQSVTAANGFTNFGTIALSSDAPTDNGAGLFVTNGTLVNRGDITVEDAGGSSTHTIQARIENHGRIHIGDSITFSKAGGVYVNHGVLTVAAGRTLTIGGNAAFTNRGVIAGGGTLALSAGTVFRGIGDITASIVNSGRLGPGLSPGVLNVIGNYQQSSGGALDVEIAGLNPGTGFDRLNISGTATLAGTLNVSVLAGFCVEGSFPIMTFGSRAGDFEIKNGLNAGGGRSLVAAPGAAAYALTTSGPACNNAPVANDDSYSTDAGVALNVPAPGVLGNDTDAQGDALTATLANGPSSGALTLNADGSFTYAPNAGFSGTDSFTYRAHDGQGASGLGVVRIAVRVTAPPAITAFSPTALTVGLVRPLTISGERFANPRVTLRRGELEIVGRVLLSTSTAIQAEFDVTSVPHGEWMLIVENQNGQRTSASIFLDMAIILTDFAWDGLQRFPVRPAGEVNAFPNYLTIFNGGLTDGMVLVTLELPHPAMRLRVGSQTAELHTGGTARFLMWAPRGTQVRVPLYWGISPEDINFPGMPVDPMKVTFGEVLSFKVRASMGLTAGSGQLSKVLVDVIIKSVCGEIKDTITGEDISILERALHAAIEKMIKDKLKKDTGIVVAKTPQEFWVEVAGKLLEEIPGYAVAKGIAKCVIELGEALVESWEKEIGDLSRTLCNDPGEVERLQMKLQEGALNFRSSISARSALLNWASEVAQGKCDPPAVERHFEGRAALGFDPNDKAANSTLFCSASIVDGSAQCAPYFAGPDHLTDPIEYVIQFENKAEATAPAENVVITDVLDDDLDPSTVRIVATSHPERFSFDVVGNVATFRWTGIDLPPNVESPEGEGDVMFTIQPRAGLPSGTEIRNSASIVFDFNPPIVTPEVVHVIDTAPPVTTATPSVGPNGHGWNRTDLSVTLRGDDGANGSGAKQIHIRVDGGPEQILAGAIAVVPLTTEGVHTINYFAVDNVGNTEVERVLTVRIDKTPPRVTASRSPAPNAFGWNNVDVTVSFACSDELSGLSAAVPADVVLGAEGAGQSVTRGCADLAGNMATATIGGINIDKTAPEAALTFAPALLDLAVVGNDSLAGIDTVALVSTALVSGRHEDGGEAQLRTYRVLDRADNALTLVVRVTKHDDDKQRRGELVSLQYQDGLARGPLLFAPENHFRFDWKRKSSTLARLDQRLELGRGGSRHRLDARFEAKDGRTEIRIDRPGEKTEIKLSGLVPLLMNTRRGALAIGF